MRQRSLAPAHPSPARGRHSVRNGRTLYLVLQLQWLGAEFGLSFLQLGHVRRLASKVTGTVGPLSVGTLQPAPQELLKAQGLAPTLRAPVSYLSLPRDLRY